MPSSLQELVYRKNKLTDKLQRLLNLQSMMTKEDKKLNGDIAMTRLRIDDIGRDIDNYRR